MQILSERLRVEALKQSWNRGASILHEAADEIDKLKNQITDNEIMHVREINKLRKQIKDFTGIQTLS